MLVPNQAVPTQSPHNPCVGSAASKRSSTAESILAFIYTRMQSVASPKGVKERIFLTNLWWNEGREPRWFLLCNWECKIYRVMLKKWFMERLQHNLLNLLCYQWSRPVLIFPVLFLDPFSKNPSTPKTTGKCLSSSHLFHLSLSLLKSKQRSNTHSDLWNLGTETRRRGKTFQHTHTRSLQEERHLMMPGEHQARLSMLAKCWFYRDDWQKVLLTLLEGRVFNLDSVSHLVKHLECWLDIGAASWKSKVETISSCCKKEREGRASLS